MLRAVTAMAFLFAQGLCLAQLPDLTPRIILPGEGDWHSLWLLAPEVAVVKIRSTEWLGGNIEVTAPEKLVVRLVGVDADVENVIAGELRVESVRFYFFTNVLIPNRGYTTHRSWFEPGRRYVVFLRRDGDILRTMSDLEQPEVRIRSGYRDALPQLPRNANGFDIGAMVAAVALTPSKHYDEDFARGLEDTYSRILQITSPGVFAELLRDLLGQPDQKIREHACLTLVTGFIYRDPCLPSLLRSNDSLIKEQAKSWLPGKLAAGSFIIEALKTDPVSLSISGRAEDLASDLELFTFDFDGEVRQQACLTLSRLYPMRRSQACTAIRGGER